MGSPHSVMRVTLWGLLGTLVVECLIIEVDRIIKAHPKPRIYDRVGGERGCGIPPQKFFSFRPIGPCPGVGDITPFQLEPHPKPA